MSNSLDPDQARRFVGPDLGPNCLQRLSADDTIRQSYNHEISVLITSVSSEDSGKSAHMRKLARAFAAHIVKVWM